MKFLGTLIVIASLSSAGFMFFYFDSKIKEYKRNVLALNNQILKVKSSIQTQTPIKTQSIQQKEITISYTTPAFKYGITLPYTAVYLAPTDQGFIVNKLKEKLQVELIEEAELEKETWYFVSLGLNTNINSKGWIRKSQFSMFTGNNSDITTMSYR